MSYDIGPKIGVEGEKAFKSAIKGVNAQVKNLSAEMKAMMASFDKADQSEEKLTAQNKILVKSIEATKTKISILTDEYEKQKSELDNLGAALEKAKRDFGEQSEEAVKAQNAYNRQAAAVNALGTQINNATADMRGMERQLSDNERILNDTAGAANEASDSIDDIGDSFDNASDQASVFGDVLKANIFADAFKAGIAAMKDSLEAFTTELVSAGDEYKRAYNNIKVQTGATAEEMKRFGDVMKGAYANNFGDDMNDVADALSQIVRQLGDGLDDGALQGLVQDAITLRDAFDYDVSESVRAAKAMMDQFGITAEEAFGLIAKGTQNNLNYSGELIDNINEYSVQFGKLGLSAEDMFAIFQSGTDAGAWNLDKIGDAIKELSIRAIDGSNTTIDGFKRIGMNANDMAKKFAAGGDSARTAFYQVIDALGNMEDPVAQSIAGVDLFGTMWEDLGPKVVTQLDNIKGGYDDAASAMDQIATDKYDDFGSVMQELGRNIQNDFLMPISEQLIPRLKEVAERLKEAFQNPALQESVGGISDAIANFAEGIADFAENGLPDLIEGFLWIVDHASQVASGIAGIVGAIAGAKAANGIVDIVRKAKELGGIGALLSSAFAAIGGPVTIAIAAIAGIAAAIATLWNTNEDFRNAVISAWESIKETASNVWGSICTFFTETVPNAWNSVVEFFQSAPEFFSGVWENIKSFFVNGWNAIVSFFTESVPAWITSLGEWFDELPYKLGYALGEALAKVKEWCGNVKSFVTETIPQVISNICDWFSQLPSRIWAFLSQAVQKIAAWGNQTAEKASSAASNAVSTVANWFSQLPSRVWNFLSETVQKLIAWGKEMVNTGKTKAQEVVDGVISTFKSLPDKVREIGANVITGFWNGLQSKIQWIKDKVASFVQGIKDGFTNAQAFDTHSPSKWAFGVGVFVMQGLANGMKSGNKTAISTARKTADRIKTAIESEIEKINESIAQIEREANERKAAEELASYKKSVEDKYKELETAETGNKQKILDEIAKLEDDWNEKQVEKAETAAKEAKNAQLKVLQDFQKEYENALSEIEKSQDSMIDKLSNYGDLFSTVNENGREYLELGDLQKDIDQINAYGDALQRLKDRGISDSLMDEITGMDVDDALAYSNKLLGMTDDKYAEYMTLWEQKQQDAQKVAQKFYQSEFDALNNEFVGKIPDELDGLKTNMQDLGVQSAKGLAQGFYSMKSYVVNTFVSVVEAARKAAARAEEIHSPSRKWARLGDYMAQGLGVGFVDQMRTVARQIADSIPTPAAPQISAYQRTSEATVNGIAAAVQSSGIGGKVVVEVPVYLDGREVTRIVADHWPQVNRQRGVALG